MTVLNHQGLRVCQCEQPSEHPNPIKAGTCVKCGYKIQAKPDISQMPWASSDKTVKEFWDRLELGKFPNTVVETREGHPHFGKRVIPDPPEWFTELRELSMRREREGRELYGMAYLQRDNIHPDANEEASDFLNYLFFDHLKAIFEEGHDDNLADVLNAASSVVDAYQKTQDLRAKRRGAP